MMLHLLSCCGDAVSIELAVHPDNGAACSLYASLGFDPSNREENFFCDGEPRLIMVRSPINGSRSRRAQYARSGLLRPTAYGSSRAVASLHFHGRCHPNWTIARGTNSVLTVFGPAHSRQSQYLSRRTRRRQLSLRNRSFASSAPLPPRAPGHTTICPPPTPNQITPRNCAVRRRGCFSGGTRSSSVRRRRARA